ncbi:MAG: ABC transporter substrate-binding protein [Methylobacteriaceae bacterium]|nr:ABC transporter substrate-binding protein [Methylobacteriaceae bacterium]
MNIYGALKYTAAFALSAVVLTSVAYGADKITFVTDFGYLGRHAYYFVALDKGYYRDAGLDVDIVRGQGSADAVKQVGAGTAQIGFADAASVILGRANDGVPVKTVAEVYAKPPHAIFTLEGSGITKPADLEGRTIADSASSSLPKLFPAYAKAAEIDTNKIKWLFVTSDAIAATLALGRADAVTYYTISQKLMEKAVAPKKLTIMKFSDVGMDFYSNGLIANDEILKSKPDQVRRFVKATLQGLKDAVADPEAAAKILNKYQRQIDIDVGTAEMNVVASLVQTPPEPLGSVNRDRMQRTIDLVKSSFDLKKPVTIDDVLADGFVPK